MTVHPTALPPSGSRSRTLAIWGVFVVGCALFTAYQVGVARADDRRVAAENAHRRRLNELHALAAQYVGEPPDVVRQAFNAPPLPVDPDADPRVPQDVAIAGAHLGSRYDGWETRVRFKYGIAYAIRPVPPPSYMPYDGPSRLWRSAYRQRQSLLVFACAAWLVAAAVLPFARRWQRNIAQFLLGAALAAALAWVLQPGRPLGAQQALAPLPILIAAGILLGVILLFLPAPAAADASPGTCRGCGYDLTGNESGACPECGRPTPRSRVERWEPAAARIESVIDVPAEVDETVVDLGATEEPNDPAASHTAGTPSQFRSGRAVEGAEQRVAP